MPTVPWCSVGCDMTWRELEHHVVWILGCRSDHARPWQHPPLISLFGVLGSYLRETPHAFDRR